MKEIKLSPKELELLAPFYETDVYQKALKPYLQRLGLSLCGQGTLQTNNFEQVMYVRGKADALKDLNRYLKRLNEESRKARETK